MQLNFYFVCSWFPPWQKSCLIPASFSWWNVAPTGFAEAAQAPWETEGWPVLEEPFKEKIHTRFNTVTGLDTFKFWEHSSFRRVTLQTYSPKILPPIPSWSCCSHSWPTCHFAEKFLVLFLSYSIKSRAALLFFLSFPLQWLSELRKYTSTFWQGITSQFQTYQRNMHWSKTIRLQHCQAHGRLTEKL